jgi:hypothetical protein
MMVFEAEPLAETAKLEGILHAESYCCQILYTISKLSATQSRRAMSTPTILLPAVWFEKQGRPAKQKIIAGQG